MYWIRMAYYAVILKVAIACACYRRGWRWYIIDCCRGIPFKLENEAVSHVLLLYYSCATNPINPTKPLRTLQMLVELTNPLGLALTPIVLLVHSSNSTSSSLTLLTLWTLAPPSTSTPCLLLVSLALDFETCSQLFRHRQLLSRNIYA